MAKRIMEYPNWADLGSEGKLELIERLSMLAGATTSSNT